MKKKKKFQVGGDTWSNPQPLEPQATPQRFTIDKDGNTVDTLTGKIYYKEDKSQNSATPLNLNNTSTVTKRSGEMDIAPWAKGLNENIAIATGIGNFVGGINTANDEQKKYLKSIQPRPYQNVNEDGGGAPIYYQNGGNIYQYTKENTRNPSIPITANGINTSGQTKDYLSDPLNKNRIRLPLTFDPNSAKGGWLDETVQGNNYNYNGGVFNDGTRATGMSIGDAIRLSTDYYMKNNPESNVYRTENSHYSINTPSSQQPRFDTSLLDDGKNSFAKTGGKFKYVKTGTYKNGGVTAEAGEIYQDVNGGMNKIPDNMDTHDDASGGVQVNDAARILEDTGDKRNDIDSKLLLINPKEMLDISGLKINKPVTHSKAFELMTKDADKNSAYIQKYMKKNAKSIDSNSHDQYAKNSLDLNANLLGAVPTQADIFNKLFEHQEAIKAKYAIDNGGEEAQFGGNGATRRAYDVFDSQNPNLNLPSSGKIATTPEDPYLSKLKYLDSQRAKQALGNTVDNPKLNYEKEYQKMLQQASRDALGNKQAVKTLPNVTVGATRDRYNPDPIDPNDYFSNPALNPTAVAAAVTAPGAPAPEVSYTTAPTQPLNSNPDNEFKAPLKWYDTAAAQAGLIDSTQRQGVKLDTINLSTPVAKYQNPLPVLQQGQEDYNTALQTLPQNGVGQANAANLYGRKYALNNQTLGQYENINSNVFNANQIATVNTKNQQAQLDAQARQLFEQKQLQGIEAQRQQFFQSLKDLTGTIASNAKYNREGNLLMKLFPAFNQEGKYNGYKYNFYNPNRTNINPQFAPKKTK